MFSIQTDISHHYHIHVCYLNMCCCCWCCCCCCCPRHRYEIAHSGLIASSACILCSDLIFSSGSIILFSKHVLFYLMCYSVCKVCFKCVFCSKCMFCFGCIWCADRKCYSVCMLCLTAYHVSLHVIFLKVCTDLCISSALSHFPFNIPALRNSYMFTLYTTMIITLKRKHVIHIKKHVMNKRHAINKQCTYFSYVIH